ncbi:TetR/AcrR family transcriptional regulator [Roseibium aestuarii]|uniref:TetR/AcrR family transcriptional regulator n=1 Tax=Roseibium aestuarii TaxID=2600299 RepID=A0ABW4JWN9_9HYPH|nr:TetR/AcrR family transcriptional regulator [Roseibium aestuarii]
MALAEQKNRQILDAAIAEFKEKGFLGASMDRISERAQVSKRTVYNHFESKEALFQQINACLFEKLKANLCIEFDADKPAKDELLRLGWAQGKLLLDAEMLSMVRMLLGEVLRAPDLTAKLNRRMDLVRIVASFLEGGVRAGKLSIPNTIVAAEQFLGMIKERAFYPQIFRERMISETEFAAILEDTVNVFLASYGARQPVTA